MHLAAGHIWRKLRGHRYYIYTLNVPSFFVHSFFFVRSSSIVITSARTRVSALFFSASSFLYFVSGLSTAQIALCHVRFLILDCLGDCKAPTGSSCERSDIEGLSSACAGKRNAVENSSNTPDFSKLCHTLNSVSVDVYTGRFIDYGSWITSHRAQQKKMSRTLKTVAWDDEGAGIVSDVTNIRIFDLIPEYVHWTH